MKNVTKNWFAWFLSNCFNIGIMETLTEEAIDELVLDIARNAKKASLRLATVETNTKNKALLALADMLEASADAIIEANRKDLDAGETAGLTSALLDRLRFTPERITGMAEGVRQVATLPDPVGEEIERVIRPNGLDIRKVRVPIGVIGIIYESRPNVTVDCAALCFKSGNACILRGGKEAFHSNTVLAGIIKQTLRENAFESNAVQLIPTVDRHALKALLKLDQYVHCIIPRGGEGLIKFVAQTARMPVIKHYKGVCCIYIDKAADPGLAESITVNAKCQRPGVCNAAENLFIHQDAAHTLLPRIARALTEQEVELRVDTVAQGILMEVEGIPLHPLTEEDLHEEYLDKILAVKVVSSLEDAIDAVNTYGSSHSDTIVTSDEKAAEQFMAGVDSATVYWNASTRFTDGFEFGIGAEIGISTDKLHARGPMGLRELTTYKYLIYGTGQIRE